MAKKGIAKKIKKAPIRPVNIIVSETDTDGDGDSDSDSVGGPVSKSKRDPEPRTSAPPVPVPRVTRSKTKGGKEGKKGKDGADEAASREFWNVVIQEVPGHTAGATAAATADATAQQSKLDTASDTSSKSPPDTPRIRRTPRQAAEFARTARKEARNALSTFDDTLNALTPQRPSAKKAPRSVTPGPSETDKSDTDTVDSDNSDTMGAFVPTSQHRHMRACMVCSIVQTTAKFVQQGCPNCEAFMELTGSQEAVQDCTSQVFEGLLTVSDTSRSWVARFQRLEGYVAGVYALQVEGILPDEVVSAAESAGVHYIPRDGSVSEALPTEN